MQPKKAVQTCKIVLKMLHHLYGNFATSFGINKIDKKYCNITRTVYTVFYNHSQTILYTKWKCNRLENEMCTQKLFWRGLFISITCHGGFAHKLSTISKQKSMENPWKICGKTQKNTTREKCKHSFPIIKTSENINTHTRRAKEKPWLIGGGGRAF